MQAFQFASVYGFRDSGGRRLVKECALFVPRKFSKTTGSAAFALWDLLFGDSNAESYTAANSQDQAKKCFDVIRGAMVRLDPDGRKYVINEQIIKPTRSNPRKAQAQCLTANARTKDALSRRRRDHHQAGGELSRGGGGDLLLRLRELRRAHDLQRIGHGRDQS